MLEICTIPTTVHFGRICQFRTLQHSAEIQNKEYHINKCVFVFVNIVGGNVMTKSLPNKQLNKNCLFTVISYPYSQLANVILRVFKNDSVCNITT